MPSVSEIAQDFTALLRAGRFEAAGARFWADDVTSVEPADLPGGIPARVSGFEAARDKSKLRFGASRIDALGIDGPFVTGNQFALFIDMVIIDRASGEGQPFTEIAIFTVRNAKISEERYFYD